MKEQKFNLTVKFHDIGSATIEGLSQEQAWQVQDVCRLIERRAPEYSSGTLRYSVTTELIDKSLATTVTYTGSLLSRLWRRLNAWMAPLLLLLAIPILSAAAMAQELKPKTLEPIRVSVASDAEATPTDRQFNDLLQAELNRAGGVAFTSARFDCKVLTATTPITERGKLTGYAAAVATLQRAGASGEFSMRLHIVTAPTLAEVAEDCGRWLDKELTTLRRTRKPPR